MNAIVCIFLTGDSHLFKLRNFAEACYRFTPVLAIRTSEALFLDITGCHTLFSRDTFIRRLYGLFKKFSVGMRVDIRVTFAQEASTALALARYSQCQRKEDLPLEALLDYR